MQKEEYVKLLDAVSIKVKAAENQEALDKVCSEALISMATAASVRSSDLTSKNYTVFCDVQSIPANIGVEPVTVSSKRFIGLLPPGDLTRFEDTLPLRSQGGGGEDVPIGADGNKGGSDNSGQDDGSGNSGKFVAEFDCPNCGNKFTVSSVGPQNTGSK